MSWDGVASELHAFWSCGTGIRPQTAVRPLMSRSALITTPSDAASAETLVGLGAWALDVVLILAMLIEPPTVPITGSAGRPATVMLSAPNVPLFVVDGVSSSASDVELAEPCRAPTVATLGMAMAGTGLFAFFVSSGGASVEAVTGDWVRTASASALPFAAGSPEETSALVLAPNTPAVGVVDPGAVMAKVTPAEEEVAAYLIVVRVVGCAPPGTATEAAITSDPPVIRTRRVRPLNPYLPAAGSAARRRSDEGTVPEDPPYMPILRRLRAPGSRGSGPSQAGQGQV
jgi:hypothetical protein